MERMLTNWRDINVGMKFRFLSPVAGFNIGDIVVIERINKETARGSLLCEKTGYRYPTWSYLYNMSDMILVEDIVHVYSPILMTGLYRTIGD